ncbi:iron chelate uptake ABC transporter family permease subunit (plasmid) [Chromobacterium amazonense]|nr:iron chelate uptake ABC transporter family permease subunit [Chromobacterium amazonense]MDE1714458.1 iron chelate uptake ABC transporter family permease subunit [Chromobacterium amazonense]
MNAPHRWLWAGLIAASLGLPWLALSSSAGHLAWPDLADPLVAQLRLPRIVAALGVGAALAASGAALQALFRNPLADPGLIGTSGGAALAVIAVLALGLAGLSLPLAAFGGGLAATWLILLLARLAKGGLAGLLLMGLVVGAKPPVPWASTPSAPAVWRRPAPRWRQAARWRCPASLALSA